MTTKYGSSGIGVDAATQPKNAPVTVDEKIALFNKAQKNIRKLLSIQQHARENPADEKSKERANKAGLLWDQATVAWPDVDVSALVKLEEIEEA